MREAINSCRCYYSDSPVFCEKCRPRTKPRVRDLRTGLAHPVRGDNGRFISKKYAAQVIQEWDRYFNPHAPFTFHDLRDVAIHFERRAQ